MENAGSYFCEVQHNTMIRDASNGASGGAPTEDQSLTVVNNIPSRSLVSTRSLGLDNEERIGGRFVDIVVASNVSVCPRCSARVGLYEAYGICANCLNMLFESIIKSDAATFKCCLCEMILINPVQTHNCGHRMCKKCVQNLLADLGGSNRFARCPVRLDYCDVIRSLDDLHPDNFVTRQIAKYTISCDLCNNDKIEFQYTKQHFESCLKRYVFCGDCAQIMPVFRLINHQQSLCCERLVTCQYCNERIKSKDTKQHEKEICKNIPIKCQSCNIQINGVMAFNQHDSICLKKNISCVYPTCNSVMMRENMREHLLHSQHLIESVGLYVSITELHSKFEVLTDKVAGFERQMQNIPEARSRDRKSVV